MSEDLFRQAMEKLDDSARMHSSAKTLLQSFDYRGAVEQAQHSIEVAIKAVWLAVEGKHPFTHDVKEKEFGELLKRLEFKEIYLNQLRDKLARAGWISTMWGSSHNISVYGFAGPQASAIFTEKDAKIAIEYCWEVYLTCRQTIDEIKRGNIAIRKQS